MKNILHTLLLIIPLSIFAQLDNSPFYAADSLNGEKNDLYFNLSLLPFNKNNEYYSKFTNGQTYLGYQLNPYLEYYLTDNISITGGVFATKDFGGEKFSQTQPFFQVKMKRKNDLFIFGNINGNVNHKYIEPLYDFNSMLYRPQEMGMQYLVKRKYANFDLWLDWSKNIYVGDPFLEEINLGFSGEIILSKKENSNFTIPAQFIFYHEGGQIDASDDEMKLFTNGSIGFKYTKKVKSKFIDEFSTENHLVYYKDHMIYDSLQYHGGGGIYLNASLKSKAHAIMISYWHGNHFQSFRGDKMFFSQSMSYKGEGTISANQNLLFIRIISNYQLSEDIQFSMRFEPYYDFNKTWKKTFKNGIFDFSNSLFIGIKKQFFIKKIQPRKIRD